MCCGQSATETDRLRMIEGIRAESTRRPGICCSWVEGFIMSVVTIVARIRAKKGREQELHQALLTVIPPTRKEKGCMNYDMFQDQTDPGLFFFYENWASTADLDNHLGSAHIKAFAETASDYLMAPPEIWRVTKVS